MSVEALGSAASVGDYLQLLKPRVMSLVVFTAFVGLTLAPGTVHPWVAAVAILCILIGAGVRTNPSNFLLFEKLINVVHEHAPQAKLCFNQLPSDIAEAVKRWL